MELAIHVLFTAIDSHHKLIYSYTEASRACHDCNDILGILAHKIVKYTRPRVICISHQSYGIVRPLFGTSQKSNGSGNYGIIRVS